MKAVTFKTIVYKFAIIIPNSKENLT